MKHKNNLILMERYHFFASSCRQFGFNCKSLAETKSDENETDGALAKILEMLKEVHCTFFDVSHLLSSHILINFFVILDILLKLCAVELFVETSRRSC
jgi:hypothetical protein